MSDLPITPQQALQLIEAMEETAGELTDPLLRSQWLARARELRRYVEVSANLWKQDRQQKPN